MGTLFLDRIPNLSMLTFNYCKDQNLFMSQFWASYLLFPFTCICNSFTCWVSLHVIAHLTEPWAQDELLSSTNTRFILSVDVLCNVLHSSGWATSDSDFIWPFLWPYMGVIPIPNPKMPSIFPTSCTLALIFSILIKYFPKCEGKGSK